MGEYVRIYPHDSKAEVFLFHRNDPSGRRVLSPRYADLACPRCGKFDEKMALMRGVDDDIVVRSTRDLIGALDGQYIIGDRLRAILDGKAEGQVRYVAIPASPAFCAAMPNYLVAPKLDDPAFRIIGNPCKVCGRHLEDVRGQGTPTLPSGLTIGAFAGESRIGMRAVWFVSRELADVLRATRPKLTGLFFDPKTIPAS